MHIWILLLKYIQTCVNISTKRLQLVRGIYKVRTVTVNSLHVYGYNV